ncbi:MAG: tRNA (N(6)-L-threonylcarbamoyladenosine(37)-C(2))-methylthiotransferase MtaB [Oscillospiraceae bacterium]|nr:tRNA (N(6)-L-threonylcarbamoyladenosine(37)-C(2))-methylthiotransferase MtaB [Oscillospiraceae bacterium]
MNIYFYTLGCKVNQYETAALKQLFSDKGYIVTDKPDNADICIINTCTVTSESDSKARQVLRKLRKKLPHAVIAVTGCYPQASPEAEKLLPEADIVSGTKDRLSLPKLIDAFIRQRDRIVYIPEYKNGDCYEKLTCRTIPGHTRAFLKIQDGCNRFCSYCMIPYSRGRIRSKPPEELKAEVSGLAQAGYREVVLTGINLAFYGSEYGMTLADAAEICASVNGIERIRFGSLEPEMMTDSELDRLAALEQICPSFHLSLQSGCEKTLRAMNRHYTPDEYFSLVQKLRSRFPHCAVTTDIMTGFPGETDEDFAESCAFAEKVGFADIHIFPYSVRKGTRAEKMPDQVPEDIKHKRAAILAEKAAVMRRIFLEAQVGKTVPVLFEREKSDGFHRGFTPNYTMIKILTKYSEKSLRNHVFYVTIDKIEDDCCMGHISSESHPKPL